MVLQIKTKKLKIRVWARFQCGLVTECKGHQVVNHSQPSGQKTGYTSSLCRDNRRCYSWLAGVHLRAQWPIYLLPSPILRRFSLVIPVVFTSLYHLYLNYFPSKVDGFKFRKCCTTARCKTFHQTLQSRRSSRQPTWLSLEHAVQLGTKQFLAKTETE